MLAAYRQAAAELTYRTDRAFQGKEIPIDRITLQWRSVSNDCPVLGIEV
jgi:hypothetical protein